MDVCRSFLGGRVRDAVGGIISSRSSRPQASPVDSQSETPTMDDADQRFYSARAHASAFPRRRIYNMH